MIIQNKIKLINSLSKKKYREINKLFIAEGERLINDLMNSDITISEVYATEEWLNYNIINDNVNICITTEQYLKKISQLKTAPPVIALCQIPNINIDNHSFENNLTLALDDIQDPGNLGTIIRLADWFGVESIICSENTADAFNPKVVQATMGAISRVKLIYTNLEVFLEKQNKMGNPIYGTFLDGDNIYLEEFSPNGIIVMGNEGNGISQKIANKIKKRLLIPSFSTNNLKSESLNVSTATGIILSEFKRKTFKVN